MSEMTKPVFPFSRETPDIKDADVARNLGCIVQRLDVLCSPPRLVALESDAAHGTCYVNPAHVAMLHDAHESKGNTALIEVQGARRIVKGTPAEVAAKLGLTVEGGD